MRQDFAEAIKIAIHNEILAKVHTAVPGKVVEYDPTKGLATIEPLAYTLYNGQKVPYPRLYRVPIIFPSWSSIAICGAVEPDDKVLLIFMERSLDTWKGNDEFPTTGAFRFENAVAFPGFLFGATEIGQKAQENGSLIIKNGEVEIEVLPDKMKITGDIVIDGTVTYAD